MQVVGQFMHKKTKPFVLLLGLSSRHFNVALCSELSDCVGDGVVQAAVQRAELIDRKWRVAFYGEVSDGLTQSP